MFLSELSVRRPVFATVMSLVLVVLGIMALSRLQVRQYPDIDPPVVSISTSYRGASAAVIDAEVTKRLVDQLSGIEGIRTIESTSSDESSRIDVEFTLGRSLDLAAADVRDQISRARRNLPDDIDNPIVTKASSDAFPIMWITLTSPTRSPLELTDLASRSLAEPLSIVSGVAGVRIGGQRRYAIRIWLDREAMAARRITVDDIAARLEAENAELPAGRIESVDREFSVRALSRLRTPDEFAALVLRDESAAPAATPEGRNASRTGSGGGGGGRVRLGDVARVELEAENDRSGFWLNGQQAVSIGIIRQSNSNTIDVANAVRAELDRLRAALPVDVEMRVASDDSLFIRASIREVAVALGIAVFLVILVILIFLRSLRAMIIPAVAIPVSLISTAVILLILGFSINVLTLLAAVLAIGLVVDDAIVVLENTDRRIRAGEPPAVAAVRGAREVGFAVIATTAVLVAVFVPISFLTGKVGRLFTEFGITLAASVIVSSFVALTLGPMLASTLLRPIARKDPSAPRPSLLRRILGLPAAAAAIAMGMYRATIAGTLRLGWVGAILVIIVGSGAAVLYQALPKELTPVEDQGRFFISLETPEGASLAATTAQVRKVESILDNYRGEGRPLATVLSIVAPGWGGASAVNTARIIVRPKPWSERDMAQQDIVRELQPQLMAIPGARIVAINPPGLGIRGGGQPIQYALGAPDFESARQWSQILVDTLRDDPRFVNLRAEFESTKPQLQVEIDRVRAFSLGLNVRQIGLALQGFLGGREVTEFYDRGELYKVILQASPDDRSNPSDLSNIYVRSSSGALIPLASVVTLTEAGVVRDLRRVNRSPSVVISGSIGQGASLGSALDTLDAAVAERLPPEARVNYLGESLEYRDSSSQLFITFGLALLIVYLVLAAQFESFIHPITILVAVPLAVTGGLGALMITGISLNIYSQIGLILLVGLVAKNGILLVEFANQLRARGMSIPEAARGAAEIRLRPILMTTISTVLGAMPLVLAQGAGAEGRRAIGIVVVGGMVFATALTLLVIPALYTLLARLTSPSNKAAARLEALLLEHAEHPHAEPTGNGHARPAHAGLRPTLAGRGS
jgi:multidrug efflux pump